MNFKTTKEMNQHNEITLLKLQLQQYKSIVKTVDPDNLPVESVLSYELVWNEFRLGHLYTSKAGGVYCDPDLGDAPKLYEVTHYIETKDLIKLFK